jgi:hypothetical protein
MKRFITIFLLLISFTIYTFGQRPRKTPVPKKTPLILVAQPDDEEPPPFKPPPTPKPTPKPSINDEGLKVGVSFEKYINTYEINADATYTQTLEIDQKLNSALMLENLNKDSVEFNSDLQEVEVVYAYVTNSAGKRTDVPKSKIEIKLTPQAEAAPAFSSIKVVNIDFGTLSVGDTVSTKVKIKNKKPEFDGKFSDIVIFPIFFDYKSAEINLIAPIDFPINFDAIGVTGGKLSDADGKSHWQWKKTPSKALGIISTTENIIDLSPRIAISSFKDYDDLGNSYWKEAKSRSAVTPEIQKLADEITKGITEPKAQAAAIYEWANKNIRYLSIIVERGGWVPHSVNSILENGYGDCKDYTTLLSSLLEAKGIESVPLAISLEKMSWFPKVATPETFDHIILYIPSLNVYADATAPNTRLGLISALLRGKTGILVGKQTGKHLIPEEKPEDNQFISDVNVTFSANGEVRAVSHNSFFGQPEISFRPVFADADFLKHSNLFVSSLLKYYGINGTGKILSMSDAHKVGEPFTVDMEINLDNYLTFLSRGEFNLPLMLNLNSSLDLESSIKDKSKRGNSIIGTAFYQENFDIKFPKGVLLTNLPKNNELSNEVGSFKTEYKLENDSLKIKRQLVIKKGIINAEEYPKLKELVRKALDEFTVKYYYSTNSEFVKPSKNVAQKPSKPTDLFKPLTPKQVLNNEAIVAKNPNDFETRKILINHYENLDKLTAKQKTTLTQHKLWFIKNRPEENISTGFFDFGRYYETDDPNYKILKDEWLKQVEIKKDNFAVLQNAYRFFRLSDKEIYEKILTETVAKFPDNYDALSDLFTHFYTKYQYENDETVRKTYLNKALEVGEKNLAILKKERSSTRDSKRADLLPQLAELDFEIGNYTKVNNYARELVLEFGDDETDFLYADATHLANYWLGRVALKENKIKEAKDYLLISIKAPLRKKSDLYFYPKLELADELLQLNEKDVVLEYLKLCEQLSLADKTLIDKWLVDIKAGKKTELSWY